MTHPRPSLTQQHFDAAVHDELWQKERHELQGHITTLKEQHAQTKENYDELQHQVWGADVREGRRLIADGASLAAELENLSEAEVCFYLLLSLSYCIEGFVFYFDAFFVFLCS